MRCSHYTSSRGRAPYRPSGCRGKNKGPRNLAGCLFATSGNMKRPDPPAGAQPAQERDHLRLLPSGPDRVRGSLPRGTQPSSPLSPSSPTRPDLERELSPAIADCGYRAPLVPRLARPGLYHTRPHPSRQGYGQPREVGSAHDASTAPTTEALDSLSSEIRRLKITSTSGIYVPLGKILRIIANLKYNVLVFDV